MRLAARSTKSIPGFPDPRHGTRSDCCPKTLDGPPLLFEPPFDDAWIDYDGPEQSGGAASAQRLRGDEYDSYPSGLVTHCGTDDQNIPNERNNSISLTLGSHVNAGSVTDAIELLIGDFTLYLNAPTGGFPGEPNLSIQFQQLKLS